jgi:hypothetical protein
MELVNRYGSKSWLKIASELGTRCDAQCRYHFSIMQRKMRPSVPQDVAERENGAFPDPASPGPVQIAGASKCRVARLDHNLLFAMAPANPTEPPQTSSETSEVTFPPQIELWLPEVSEVSFSAQIDEMALPPEVSEASFPPQISEISLPPEVAEVRSPPQVREVMRPPPPAIFQLPQTPEMKWAVEQASAMVYAYTHPGEKRKRVARLIAPDEGILVVPPPNRPQPPPPDARRRMRANDLVAPNQIGTPQAEAPQTFPPIPPNRLRMIVPRRNAVTGFTPGDVPRPVSPPDTNKPLSWDTVAAENAAESHISPDFFLLEE